MQLSLSPDICGSEAVAFSAILKELFKKTEVFNVFSNNPSLYPSH